MSSKAIDPQNVDQQDEISKKIQEERKISKKSLVAIEKKWKAILTNEKLKSLKDEFEQLQNSYRDEVARKNEMVKHLVNRFEESEDMRRTAIASHLQTIDGMVNVNHNQLTAIEKKIRERIRELRDRYNTERASIVNKFEIDKNSLLNEIDEYQYAEQRISDKGNRDQQEALQEIRNKNLEDINSLRFILDTRIEDLDEQFELAKNEYLQKTEVQSDSLQQKLLRDGEMTKEMIILQKKIDKLCFSVKKLKRIAQRKSMQNMDRNQQLVRRKSEIISRYKKTKAKMDNLRITQYEKLKDLTIRSSREKSELEEEFFLAEKIFKLTKLISKLEKQDGLGDANELDFSVTKFDANLVLGRYNQVLLHYESAKKEEEKVLEQNRLLKGKIRKFQDGITVNERVILSNNPLVILNGRIRPESACSQKSFSPRSDSLSNLKAPRRLTTIDANHAFAMSHAR